MAYPYNSFNKKGQKQRATEKYKNYEYGAIAITVQPGDGLDIKTREPFKVINLYNVDKDSANAIVERLLDKTKGRVTRNAWIDKEEPTHVQIKVFDSEIDKWLDGGDLNAIQSILLKAGYNADEVMHFEDEIATGFSSFNKEKINKTHSDANENAMEMWQRYLSKISDPVTRKQLELYSRVYGNVNYGHILSIRNVSLIKSLDKDATFVLAPSAWRNEFGRGVKRNAKPLPLYVPISNSKATAKDIEDSKRENGWEGTDDDDLSTQVKYNIKLKANKSNGGIIKRIGYDVKDTYLLSGAKEDKWTTEMGLLNNLTGELNQAAILNKQQRNAEDIDVDTVMDKRTEKAADWMEKFCQNEGLNTKTLYKDAGNRLADYLLNYCTANATERANILSEGNIRTYAENATQVTLIITNLGLNALSRFNKTYEYSKPEAVALMNIVFRIARALETNSMISESIGTWFRDKIQFVKMFVKALKMIGCGIKKDNNNQPNVTDNNQISPVLQNQLTEHTMREKFYNVFDRINKNLF